MDVVKAAQLSGRTLERVVVHPLVLLSIVDHYNRVARDTRKRVVGVLLGTSSRGSVDVTNSYAGKPPNPRLPVSLSVARVCAAPVPFEEDDKDPRIWFLDHNYHESMFSMFKRINAKEHVVGWYSTGPKLRENDLDVHALFNSYVPNPVLVIIDVQPKELGIPTKAYYAVEEVKENATQKSQKVFVHVPSEIAAHEVEEIGVEHLLRDVKDTTISTLATEVSPSLAILKTNDMMLVIYLSSLIRSVIALHNLINNKVGCFYLLLMLNKEHEKAEDSKPAAIPTAAGGGGAK
ncbi:26S proteasome non-ATPase regulatory subunit 7 homolog A [Zea mays]|uniref:26S proteasome non-ATPase regulatory subunit 7 homolog A n=1 Tax=Zea mays TaxID=4577 RepID=A0A1D6JGZ9_MAIZE|nr:26S proteasome non-ATPase regulatory subunit 7 homolog A [Zea mays]